MQQLTTQSLKRAIEFASEHENTSIGIFLDKLSTATAMCVNILNEYRNLRGARGGYILFSNGSTIKCIGIDEAISARGYRFNIILIHTLIDAPELRARFSLFEHAEHGHPGFFYHYDDLNGRYFEDPFFQVDEISHDNWLNCNDNYTIYFENGSSITAIPKAPDFGEFSPSQELNNFVNTLVQW